MTLCLSQAYSRCMASLAPELKPAFCAERQRLIEEFTRAVSDYLRIQSAQSHSLISGRGFEFDTEIAEARERKSNARAAIIAHQREHGC